MKNKLILIALAFSILFGLGADAPAKASTCYFVLVTRINQHTGHFSYHNVYRCHK